MTASQLHKPRLPTGPEHPYDMNTTADCFHQLGQWVPDYPDLFAMQPDKRKDIAFFVNHPDHIKHILVAEHERYHKGVGFERVKMLLGNGVIVSNGPFWRKQRRMIQPAFSRDMIATLTEQMKQINLRLFEQWQVLAQQEAVINITEVMNELALEIILRALFSEDLDKLYEQFGGNPFAMLADDSARDLKMAVKFRGLTKQIAEIIDYRRQQPDSQAQDFLSVFLAARDKDTGEPMSDKAMIDEIMTLIVAGSETSATTLNWTWYSLARYPQVQAKVHQEVDSADYEHMPGFEHIAQLPYLRQVVEEVLRLYPPVWLYTRKAIEDDKLGDYDIPAGSDIFIAPYFLHRHPDYWPQPEQFDPDRFTPEAIKQRHKFAFIPFSAGPRRCIGDFFGIVEAQIHFGLMARYFKMEYVEDNPIELAPEVNLRTKHPINMRILTR